MLKKLFCLLFLIVISSSGMVLSPAQAKQATVDAMLELTRAQYSQMHDQVCALRFSDLEQYMALPEPEYHTANGERYFPQRSSSADSYQSRKNEFGFLIKLATKIKYAPLIPVLFKNNDNSYKSPIAQSMLLHALQKNSIISAQELLKLKIDINVESIYLLQSYSPYSPLAVAVGKYAQKSNPLLVQMLFDSGAKIPGTGSELLMDAIETYYYGDEKQKMVIEALLKNGANPFAVSPASKWVGRVKDGVEANSAIELARGLAVNNPGDAKFTELVALFEKYNPQIILLSHN
ncbi:hypothetical protein BH09DEP1_BH09DEP1_3020 [soil metagenome]